MNIMYIMYYRYISQEYMSQEYTSQEYTSQECERNKVKLFFRNKRRGWVNRLLHKYNFLFTDNCLKV